MKYWIFGSKSSQDVDILAVVDQLGTIAENKATVEAIEKELQSKYSRPLNVNLGTMEDGVLTNVYKGTVDEVNNSLVDTYPLHEQAHDLLITRKIPRDVDLKVLRSLRIILSFYSRTKHRKEVKTALSGDVVLKHQVLSTLDISTVEDLGGGKNMAFEDYLKTLAFQLGQTLALLEGVELYTKESIEAHFPALGPFLKRTRDDLSILEDFKKKLLSKIDPKTLRYQKEEPRK